MELVVCPHCNFSKQVSKEKLTNNTNLKCRKCEQAFEYRKKSSGDAETRQSYKLATFYGPLIKLGVLFFLFAAFLSFASPFWFDYPFGIVVLHSLLGIVFVGFTVWCLTWVFRYKKVNIEIDADGIWYEHQPKQEGLVPWEQIRSIRDRVARHIDLLDLRGRSLIRITEGLDGELDLMQQIINRAPNLYTDFSFPLRFTTLTKTLEINEEGFVLKSLGRIDGYRFDEIEHVELWREYIYQMHSGYHVLRVSLFAKKVTEPIKIPRFSNVEVVYLYKLFKKLTGV